jgi:hypothetical protein
MRNVSDKSCRESENTHFIFNNFFQKDIACKVFSNVLNERLKKITENLLGEYQCGFRKNRSTSDQIFVKIEVPLIKYS